MTYTFVQAYHDYGLRKGPVKAFVVHMAEGGGTVGYLSRDASRGVSVHYVIEYSGRIVQMLREDHASGSINPGLLRTTEGPAPYGAKVRKLVMGSWDSDPNAAVISLEIEGFAAAGPNDDQRRALLHLVTDVRSRFPKMGLLGHRDFADYKACPGGKIPWSILGGHGPASATAPVSYVVHVPASTFWRFYVSGYGGSHPKIVSPYRQSITTAGFSATCTAPFRAYDDDDKLADDSYPLVKLTGGSRAGWYIDAKYAVKT